MHVVIGTSAPKQKHRPPPSSTALVTAVAAQHDGEQCEGRPAPCTRQRHQRAHTAAGRHRAARHRRRQQQPHCDGKQGEERQVPCRGQRHQRAQAAAGRHRAARGIGVGSSNLTMMAGRGRAAGTMHEATAPARPHNSELPPSSASFAPEATAQQDGERGEVQPGPCTKRSAPARPRCSGHRRRRQHTKSC